MKWLTPDQAFQDASKQVETQTYTRAIQEQRVVNFSQIGRSDIRLNTDVHLFDWIEIHGCTHQHKNYFWFFAGRRSVELLNNFGHSSHIPPHTEVTHLPFDYLNKRAFTYKFVSFLGLGFALPWVAIGWIWYRPGGLKNPY
ncbi:cytochrome c oxidase subunit VIIc [Lentinula edodes]|uniref:Cytochrome c oxidase subunit VIIc n=1 Tax=Lentinula edodes TaxID=5353 RepID=A0A1Q3ER76_LENED|nr:cytochrome c oxidase subunit VIIc [Lentinula edodes]